MDRIQPSSVICNIWRLGSQRGLRVLFTFILQHETAPTPFPTPPRRSQQWRQESFHKKTWASEIFHSFHCLKNCTYRLWPTFELSRIRRLLFFSFVFLGYLLPPPPHTHVKLLLVNFPDSVHDLFSLYFKPMLSELHAFAVLFARISFST